jgi:hypothetical protein
MWLVSEPGDFADYWRPLQSGAALQFQSYPDDGDPLALIAWHDQSLPFKLHEEPYLSDLRERAKRYRVLIAFSAQDCYELRPPDDPAPAESVAERAEPSH